MHSFWALGRVAEFQIDQRLERRALEARVPDGCRAGGSPARKKVAVKSRAGSCVRNARNKCAERKGLPGAAPLALATNPNVNAEGQCSGARGCVENPPGGCARGTGCERCWSAAIEGQPNRPG